MGFWDKEEESVESIKERRSRKMDRFMKMQVLPVACRFLLAVMLVLTPLAVLADVTSFQRYGMGLDVKHLLWNASITAFTLWTIPALVLLALSLFQLHRLGNGFEEKKPEKLTPADFGDHNRYDASVFAEKKTKQIAPEKKYKRYCVIAITGMLAFGLVLAIVSSL